MAAELSPNRSPEPRLASRLGWHDGATFEAAVLNLKNGTDDPNAVNYLIQMLTDGDRHYFQQPPDSNTNSDFPAAYRVLRSAVPITVVVGPLAQQVTIKYDEIGAGRTPTTLLTRFLQAGARKRDLQRDVVAWDSTAFNYLLLREHYRCAVGNRQFVPYKGFASATEGVKDDACFTHREPDAGGWTSSEYCQLWVGDLAEIDAATVALDVPIAQRITEDPAVGGVTRPSANTVQVCYDFESADGPQAVADRIQTKSY